MICYTAASFSSTHTLIQAFIEPVHALLPSYVSIVLIVSLFKNQIVYIYKQGVVH